MGPAPKKIEAANKPVKAEKPVPPKPPKPKIACFVMDTKPAKPGMLVVSTGKVLDGCFVLGFQEQSATWLVSSGSQWFAFSNKLMTLHLAMIGVMALVLLFVAYLNRSRVR